MPGIQTVIVVLILALAAYFTFRKFYRIATGKDGGCHCDGGCGLSNPMQCKSSNEESAE